MKFDVSVVVPLYNAEKFIRFCVDSLLNQTLERVEVVIVDDCSPDNSLNLCRELYGNNEKVQIIQQPKNAGPGAARNRGIKEARGEYIAFLDSDDEMMPFNLERFFTVAKKYDADVVHSNQVNTVFPLDDGSVPLEMLNHPENTLRYILDRGETITEIQTLTMDISQRLDILMQRRLHWLVCNKMIRRSLIVDNGLFFPDTKLAEDAVFCLQCLLTAKNYVLMPGGWHIFRMNPESLTRGKMTANTVIGAVQSQLEIVKTMKAIAKNIPALQDRTNFNIALTSVLFSIEGYMLRFAFNDVGAEALRKDDKLAGLFRENFGDNAPYVEFLFYQLHEVYPVLPKLFVTDPEEFERVRLAFKEAKAAGKEFILKR